MINPIDLLKLVMDIKSRLDIAQRNSKTAADINTVVSVLIPTLQNLDGCHDLQDSHIQNGLADLKVFLDSDLDALSRELAVQWELTKFVCATGNEDRMRNALERLNTFLNVLDIAVNAAFQQVLNK